MNKLDYKFLFVNLLFSAFEHKNNQLATAVVRSYYAWLEIRITGCIASTSMQGLAIRCTCGPHWHAHAKAWLDIRCKRGPHWHADAKAIGKIGISKERYPSECD